MISKARHDEAQFKRDIETERDKYWEDVVAEKNTTLEKRDAALAERCENS
ncbi:MAG: hypothetical protein FWD05_00565 [Oscillospiraceae bacterium]|nr:hypothetical protein [Oscillospiraceae bacterium]